MKNVASLVPIDCIMNDIPLFLQYEYSASIPHEHFLLGADCFLISLQNATHQIGN